MAALDVTTQERVSKFDDLKPVIGQLAEKGYDKVTILAFSLYAQEKPNPHPRPSRGGNRR